jgi:hypothetical protein
MNSDRPRCETPAPRTEIEAGISDDDRRLSDALGGSIKPLPASNIESCRELLESQRRESITRPTARYDEIDHEAAADPIHDHRPQSAPGHKVNRTLAILDELARGNSNRRFGTR